MPFAFVAFWLLPVIQGTGGDIATSIQITLMASSVEPIKSTKSLSFRSFRWSEVSAIRNRIFFKVVFLSCWIYWQMELMETNGTVTITQQQINGTETSHGQFWLQGFECIRDACASRRMENSWSWWEHFGSLPCFFPNTACHVVHLNSILAKTYDNSNTNNHNHVIRHCQKHK